MLLDSLTTGFRAVAVGVFAGLLMTGCATPAGAGGSVGQDGAGAKTDSAPRWFRHPAVSPSGDQVAFTFGGQVWVVSAKGGEAVPLTTSNFYAVHPVWSPDGKSIAFGSTRFGNLDVFIMPATGGEIRRLTFHSSDDAVSSFSPDGKLVYFTSSRLGDAKASFQSGSPAQALQVYSVPAEGGRERLVIPTAALDVQLDSEGKHILYTSVPSPENTWRKHAISDATRDIWLFDAVPGKHRRLTTFRGEDREPVWAPDGKSFYYLSEKSGSSNVWKKSLAEADEEPAQVTKHTTHPVRFLSIAKDGSLVYAYDGALWRLGAGESAPAPIAVQIRQSSLLGGEFFVQLRDQVSEFTISPTGAEYALVVRGEVFVLSATDGAARRVTTTPERERSVSFSPDGRGLLYASERAGSWGIFESRLVRAGEKTFSAATEWKESTVIDTAADETQPLYSSDGRKISFLGDRDRVRVLDLSSSSTIALDSGFAAYSYEDGDMTTAWSPDAKWVAATSGIASPSDIFLLDATGKRAPLNVTRSGSTDSRPQFSSDGQVMYWLTDRHGLKTSNGDGAQQDVYAALLTRNAFDSFRGETAGRAGDAAGGAEIDFDAQPGRIVRLTPFSMGIAHYAPLGNSGKLLLVGLDEERGVTGYVLDGKTRALVPLPVELLAGGTEVAVDAKGDSVHVLRPGVVTKSPLGGGASTSVPFAAEFSYNFRGEIAYIFDHVVRFTEVKFYDTKLHGVDWRGYAKRYREFLPSITRWEDFADVLGELVGELNASHTRGCFDNPVSYGDQTASLGVYYDGTHEGPGAKVVEILEGGPADRKGSALVAGAVIVSVDGKAIGADAGIDALLNHKAGKRVRLEVRAPGAAEGVVSEEIVVPITQAAERTLSYERWVSERKRMTAELSGGRLVYIHIPAMDLDSYERATSELLDDHNAAEGVIVDVRFNMGGNLHDQLISLLTGTLQGELISNKGVRVGTIPYARWTKPSAVLANAASYSDGSVFPHFYKAARIGPLVGERVPGTGTAVWWERQLEPRVVYGVPELGFRGVDGRWLENQEIVPDVLVYNDPESVRDGKDLQLEAAVKTLLNSAGAKKTGPPTTATKQ